MSEAPVDDIDQLATKVVVEEEDVLNERMEADGGSAEEATGTEQSDAAPAWEWDDYNVSCHFALFTQSLLPPLFVTVGYLFSLIRQLSACA